MSHTPGPWEVHGGWGGIVFAQKGDGGQNVAECNTLGLTTEELWANMHLIAAAPELLERLKAAVNRQGFSSAELIASRAVIAKAERKLT